MLSAARKRFSTVGGCVLAHLKNVGLIWDVSTPIHLIADYYEISICRALTSSKPSTTSPNLSLVIADENTKNARSEQSHILPSAVYQDWC